MDSMLRDLRFSVERPSSMRNRGDSIDDPDGVWPRTVAYFRRAKAKLSIPLSACKDGDEVCIFFAGNLGWKSKSRVIGPTGEALPVKSRLSFRRTMSAMSGTTTLGVVIPSVFLGKEATWAKRRRRAAN